MRKSQKIQSTHLNIVQIVATKVVDESPVAFRYLQPTVVAGDINQDQSQMNPSPPPGLEDINTASTEINIKNCVNELMEYFKFD